MSMVQDTYAQACSYYGHVMNKRLYWELMKMKIWSVTISFFKSKAKCISNRAQELRRRIDKLDAIFCDNFSSPYIAGVLREYDGLKTEPKSIYEEKGKQTMFRAKCRWIENGERPTKFFLNLEKVITTKNLLANVNFTRWFYYAQRDSDSRAKLKTIIETYIPRI